MRIHYVALSKQQITNTTAIAVDVGCHRLRLSPDNAGYVEIYILIKFATQIVEDIDANETDHFAGNQRENGAVCHWHLLRAIPTRVEEQPIFLSA